MLLFFLSIVLKDIIMPRLLETTDRVVFTRYQWDELLFESEISFPELIESCTDGQDETCIAVGFYFLNENLTPDIHFLTTLFDKCASTSPHCIDLVVQLQYFYTPGMELDDVLKLYDYDPSDSVFAKMLRISKAFSNTSQVPPKILIDDLEHITKQAFLEYGSDPLRAPIELDHYFRHDTRYVEHLTKSLDRYLLSHKNFQELPQEFYHHIKYKKPKELYLKDLNRKRRTITHQGQLMKSLLEEPEIDFNPTFYLNLLNECYKSQGNFNTRIASIIQLFLLTNGTRRADANPLVKVLAESGDTFYQTLLYFGSKYGIEPLASAPPIEYSDDFFEQEIIFGLFEDEFKEPNKIHERYTFIRKFLDTYPIFQDLIKAEEELLNGNINLAQIFYERLSLMGHCGAIEMVKYIRTQRGMELDQIDKLDEMFCHREETFLDGLQDASLKILKIIHLSPISGFYFARNAESITEARIYCHTALALLKLPFPVKMFVKTTLELQFLLKQAYQEIFSDLTFTNKVILILIFILLSYKLATNINKQFVDKPKNNTNKNTQTNIGNR